MRPRNRVGLDVRKVPRQFLLIFGNSNPYLLGVVLRSGRWPAVSEEERDEAG
jgi:hypothetical protein